MHHGKNFMYFKEEEKEFDECCFWCRDWSTLKSVFAASVGKFNHVFVPSEVTKKFLAMNDAKL